MTQLFRRKIAPRIDWWPPFVDNIMMPCEYAVTDKSQPFLQSANSKLGPIDLPHFSGEQRQKLDKAAQTLKEYVEGLSNSSHRLL